MAKKQTRPIIGTYARVILSDWQVLANILVEVTIRSKDQLNTEDEESTPHGPVVLTDNQVNSALEGPYAPFFKQKLTGYATIARLRFELGLKKDDAYADYLKRRTPEVPIPSKKLNKLSSMELDTLQKDLNNLTSEHFQAWQSALNEWSEQIIAALNKEALDLSDIESDDLKNIEPLAEIYDRFTDLNLELPKLKKGEMSFNQFFLLKTHLAIQSALSRQHLPHTPADIKKHLKPVKHLLGEIKKAEHQMIKAQGEETQKLMQVLSP